MLCTTDLHLVRASVIGDQAVTVIGDLPDSTSARLEGVGIESSGGTWTIVHPIEQLGHVRW